MLPDASQGLLRCLAYASRCFIQRTEKRYTEENSWKIVGKYLIGMVGMAGMVGMVGIVGMVGMVGMVGKLGLVRILNVEHRM